MFHWGVPSEEQLALKSAQHCGSQGNHLGSTEKHIKIAISVIYSKTQVKFFKKQDTKVNINK